MTWDDAPCPGVVLLPERGPGGWPWAWCEDCDQAVPVTRRHGAEPRVMRHYSPGMGPWSRTRGTARRVAYRCHGGVRHGLVGSPQTVPDRCAPCPVAVYARDLVAARQGAQQAEFAAANPTVIAAIRRDEAAAEAELAAYQAALARKRGRQPVRAWKPDAAARAETLW